MADDKQNSIDESSDAPPPADMEQSGKRQKRSRKGALLATGGLVAFFAIAWMILFGGGNDEKTPTLDGKEVSRGGASIESTVSEGGIGGGVRQEVASVQSEIEDEEVRQERLESGRSVITFGESLIADGDEDSNSAAQTQQETELPKNNTFGEIGKEPSAPPTRSMGSNPGRQHVKIAGSSRSGGSTSASAGSMSAAIAQEIERYDEEAQDSRGQQEEAVYYAPPTVKNRPVLASKPGDNVGSERQYDIGELARPGDTVAAYMMNRITSDQPSGRVVATILEGPMEGARAIGEASFEGGRLLIEFNRIVPEKGGVIHGITALAVDPHTMETSLQSGIDRKLFQRYGVPLLYGIAAIGLDYSAKKDATTVVEQDLSTGETVSRSVQTNPSFGDYMTDNVGDALDKPLGRAANEAASVKPTAWANPGVIGVMFDTAVPSS